MYALNIYPLEVISLINSFYTPIDYEYEINLSESIVSRINDDFAYAKHDDMIVKFHIPTNYIHIRSTAEALNPEKYHNQDRFWRDKDTIEFIEEITPCVRKQVERKIHTKTIEKEGILKLRTPTQGYDLPEISEDDVI